MIPGQIAVDEVLAQDTTPHQFRFTAESPWHRTGLNAYNEFGIGGDPT